MIVSNIHIKLIHVYTDHSNCIRGKHFLWRDDCKVGHVTQDIHKSYQGDGNVYGPW